MSRAGATLSQLSVFAIALFVFALIPDLPPFSDGIFLAERVRSGWTPYYNAFYLPLGWLFHRVGEQGFDWNPDQSLLWFARASCAASAVVGWRVGRRFGLGPQESFAGALLLTLTPSVLFFANVVEVHSLQLLGALVATELALIAREKPPLVAVALVLVGALLGVLTHLTSVLFVPVLVWLAVGSDARGFPLARFVTRRTVVPSFLGLGALAAAAWQLGSRVEDSTWLAPVRWLYVFGDMLRDRFASGDFFGPAESARYLWLEFVLPSGLLVALLLVALLVRATRREALVLVLLALPFLAIFSQGGIWEGGAYFLALWPLVIVMGLDAGCQLSSDRRVRAGVLVALLIVQGTLGWRYVASKRDGLDARAFARAVATHCPAGSLVATNSLPAWHSLAFSEASVEAFDLGRDLQMAPRSRWETICRDRLGQIGRHARSARTFLAAGLLHDDHPLGHYQAFRSVLATVPVELVPIPSEAPVVYEIRRR